MRTMLVTTLLVAVGSAVGGAVRYLIGIGLQPRLGTAFPVATLLINVSGSFILGFLLGYAAGSTAVSPETRVLVGTGFCGGYTTFSTFSYETAKLIEDNDWVRAGSYVALSVVLAVAGTFAGLALAQRVLDWRQTLGA